MDSLPVISVIIPAYNCAPFVPAAIQSAFDQTYPNVEVVVVNDGSPDNTDEVVQPFLDRIVYFKQANKGLSGARNAGFHQSKGEFVCFLDADDTLLPLKFEKQIALFHKEPDLGVVISGYLDIDSDGMTVIQSVEKHWHRDALDHLLIHEVFPVHAALIKREVLDRNDPFPEVVNRGEYQEDWQLWLDLALKGIAFSSVPEPTCRYWRRSGSGSSYPLKHLDGARRVVSWLKKHPLADLYMKKIEHLGSIVEMERVGRAWQSGQYDLAAGELESSIHKDPLFWREPSVLYRLFWTSLSIQEFAEWKNTKDIKYIEQRLCGEILDFLKGQLLLKDFKHLAAVAWLAVSDLYYAGNDSPGCHNAIGKALSYSVPVCLSRQGISSTIRGILGSKVIGFVKKII